jgi:hypothetical protein
MSPYGTVVEPSAQAITPPMIEALQKTKPWVRFLSILGFIACALMLLGALFMVIGGAVGAAFTSRSGMGAAGGVVLGLVYGLLALLYVFPSLFLFRYASGIATMLSEDAVRGMENALNAQKSFWRFVGILTVIILCLYAVVLAGLLVAAIVAAVRH